MTDTAPAPAAAGDAPTTAAFSLELSEDQRDVRDWVHGFAEGVVRPAAAEWDEREETPWPDHPGGREDRPLRLRGARPVLRRPDRPDAADRQRGALLGRRRHRHGDHGHLARRRRDLRPGHAASRSASGSRSASARPTSRRSPRSASSEPNAGSDVSSLRTRATLRRGHRRVGPQRPEGVGDERRHRRASTSSSPRSTRSSAPAARPRSSSRPARRASRWARRSRSTACAPRTPPTSSSTTAASPADACSAARRSSTSASRAPARARARAVAGRDGDLRGHAARPSARRRSASRARPTSTRSSTPRTASSSASRSSRTRRSRSRSPT